MPLPVVLIHGYSSEGPTRDDGDYDAATVGEIYGGLVQSLVDRGVAVVPVNVSRYVSLDDGIGIEDLSFAFERVLQGRPELKDGFNAIVHSTGALVARNWVRRFGTTDGKCPLKRLIHLAGANLGSGWAHIGASQFARFGRFILQGAQPGVAVLQDLELASDWTIDLHRHFLDPDHDMLRAYGIMEFCLVGSQVPPEFLPVPVRYGKEDGSDGVVRVSASNLNFNYVRIEPSAKAPSDWDAASVYAQKAGDAFVTDPEGAEIFDSGYYEIALFSRPGEPEWVKDRSQAPLPRTSVPFAIPYLTTHLDGRTGIVAGSTNRDEVLPLIEAALNATPDTYASLIGKFDAATAATYEKVRDPAHPTSILQDLEEAVVDALENPRGQYDRHAQLVFRVRDHLGQPVPDFSVFFNSFSGDTPDILIDKLFEDEHKNGATPNTINFYLRVECWDDAQADWTTRLDAVRGATLEIDAVDPHSHRILYLPMRLKIPADDLPKWIEPHRTTIVDVRLMRLPHRVAFVMPDGSPAPEAPPGS